MRTILFIFILAAPILGCENVCSLPCPCPANYSCIEGKCYSASCMPDLASADLTNPVDLHTVEQTDGPGPDLLGPDMAKPDLAMNPDTAIPCTAGAGMGCGKCGGTIQCDGTCSVVDPPNLGMPCGHCGGTFRCDGSCSVMDPGDYGKPCGSCGGTVRCDRSCSVATPNNYGQPCNCGTINCAGACSGAPCDGTTTACNTLSHTCQGCNACAAIRNCNVAQTCSAGNPVTTSCSYSGCTPFAWQTSAPNVCQPPCGPFTCSTPNNFAPWTFPACPAQTTPTSCSVNCTAGCNIGATASATLVGGTCNLQINMPPGCGLFSMWTMTVNCKGP